MILVCGEALIDVFVRDSGSLSVEATPGGSPFNLALGLARLGRSVGYIGALSTDLFGEHLERTLRSAGVMLDSTARLAAPTTLSFVSQKQSGEVQYDFRNEGCADRQMSLAQLPSNWLDRARCLTFGSYSLSVEPCGTAFEQMAAHAAQSGRVLSYDPNVRPTLIADWAAWHLRFERFLSVSTVVKASAEDIAHAFGATSGLTDLARSWLAKGPEIVVVTRGPQPVLAFGPFGEITVPTRATIVVDTVGAGDSFHAALIAGLDARGLLDRDALASLSADIAGDVFAYASTAAALTCCRHGADLPRLEELDAI